MISSEFKGITGYNGHSVVSDYVNMIPMGASALDRVGETELINHGQTSDLSKVRGSFVDSLHNIYIVISDKVIRYSYDGATTTRIGVMGGKVNSTELPEYNLLNAVGEVTFCETSTKPSQVMMCDGKYIYWWNTTGDESFTIQMMLSPGIAMADGVQYSPFDMREQIEDGLDQPYDTSSMAEVSSITWFNNRLVATQPDKNTVWLTCTDPAQFFRADLDPFDEQVPLWPDWYSSTNSADRLRQAIAFAGQLYLLNDSTIECWVATGDESAPLTPSSMGTVYHGGRSPYILNDAMYLVCKDQIGCEYIGCMSSGGQFSRVSNPEIEKRVSGRIDSLTAISMRESTFICVRLPENGEMFCYSTDGWWHLVNSARSLDWLLCSLIDDIALSAYGSIMRLDVSHRNDITGTPIARSVRDWFQLFPSRKIIRQVGVVMDTGAKLDEGVLTSDGIDVGNEIYCRVSFSRGLSFGPRVNRRLGKKACNDRDIVWRNLGSGNNVMVEFGTSSNYSLQIYSVEIVAE